MAVKNEGECDRVEMEEGELAADGQEDRREEMGTIHQKRSSRCTGEQQKTVASYQLVESVSHTEVRPGINWLTGS